MNKIFSPKLVVLSIVLLCGLALVSCGKKGPLQRPVTSDLQPPEIATLAPVTTPVPLATTRLWPS